MQIRYAHKKKQMTAISPDMTVSEIISGLDHAFFLVSPDGRIIISNHEAELITGGPNTGESVYDVFNGCSDIKREINCIVSGKPYNRMFGPVFNKQGVNSNIFSVQLQCVKNFNRQLTGIIILFFRHALLEELLKTCRITSRQIEIISLAVAGLSNRIIADKLLLSERTVENHLFNIYNKIGINNRIELINIVAGLYHYSPGADTAEYFCQGINVPA